MGPPGWSTGLMGDDAAWRIRPWKSGDDEGIAALMDTLVSSEPPIVAAVPVDLADIRANYHNNGGEFWVALVDDQLVGIVGGLDLGNDIVTLRNLFTHPEYRGTGLAADLLWELVEWAEAFALHTVIAAAANTMGGLIGFYERHGFDEIADDALPADFPRLGHHDRFFRRRLRSSPENPNTVHFEKIPWSNIGPGHREKQAVRGGTTARMVEWDSRYDSDTVLPGGMGGIVLEGRIRFVFDQHESVCEEGQGFVIPAGQNHRVVIPAGRARVFIL